jgi:hypothetical protein
MTNPASWAGNTVDCCLVVEVMRIERSSDFEGEACCVPVDAADLRTGRFEDAVVGSHMAVVGDLGMALSCRGNFSDRGSKKPVQRCRIAEEGGGRTSEEGVRGCVCSLMGTPRHWIVGMKVVGGLAGRIVPAAVGGGASDLAAKLLGVDLLGSSSTDYRNSLVHSVVWLMSTASAGRCCNLLLDF